MKKSNALMLMSFAMMMSDGFEMTEQGSIGTSTPDNIPINKIKPFAEQDGIVSLIREYNLIQKGESKKGKRKQVRTIAKINEMIEKEYLTSLVHCNFIPL